MVARILLVVYKNQENLSSFIDANPALQTRSVEELLLSEWSSFHRSTTRAQLLWITVFFFFLIKVRQILLDSRFMLCSSTSKFPHLHITTTYINIPPGKVLTHFQLSTKTCRPKIIHPICQQSYWVFSNKVQIPHQTPSILIPHRKKGQTLESRASGYIFFPSAILWISIFLHHDLLLLFHSFLLFIISFSISLQPPNPLRPVPASNFRMAERKKLFKFYFFWISTNVYLKPFEADINKISQLDLPERSWPVRFVQLLFSFFRLSTIFFSLLLLLLFSCSSFVFLLQVGYKFSMAWKSFWACLRTLVFCLLIYFPFCHFSFLH